MIIKMEISRARLSASDRILPTQRLVRAITTGGVREWRGDKRRARVTSSSFSHKPSLIEQCADFAMLAVNSRLLITKS